ncbi:GH32 C-terminal domain-containing protein [Terrabacter sp. GCM10028922]|uniref:GH32 C-terminal domain-containing protein n=1 Tax=Terrabacter sp. GCM10028922 TaxID=3273428 RepID=UPI00362104A8
MTSAPAPADLRRRHLVGGGLAVRLSDLLGDATPASAADGPVRSLVLDYAAVSLVSTTGRTSGLVSWATADGAAGLVLGIDRDGRPCLEVHVGSGQAARTHTAVAAAPVRPGEWHRYGLVVGDTASLYVDGEWVGELWPGGPLPAAEQVRVGARHDSALLEEVVVTEGVTGVVGQARLTAYGDVVSAVAALRSRGVSDRPPLDVAAELARWRRPDPYRPSFHFLPPAHWMNEPHGPIEVGGLHHLFFQSNRTGAHWGGIEWGHAVSTDLVRWRHLPPAVSPVASRVAPDGVWSGGSVLDDSGRPLLYVTAGDFDSSPDQSVAVARPHGEGATTAWVLASEPILRMPERDDLVPGQFRDPFVWRDGDRWFMLVGAGLVGRGGTALLFESGDGEAWQEVGPLLVGDASSHPEVGEMWELPVLLPVSSATGRSAHVLVVCPWWATVPEGRVVEVVHWLGDWDPAARTFNPWHAEPRRFDVGRHFTGPSGNVLSDGRTILWSIAQDGRTTAQQAEVGWAHNAGLPLELSLGDDDTLRVAPVRELAGLRESLLADVRGVGGVSGDGRAGVAGVGGVSEDGSAEVVADLPVGPLELDLRCATGSGMLQVDIAVGEAGELHASLRIDCGTGRFEVARPGAAAYDVWSPAVVDGGTVERFAGSAERPVRLRVFLDGSMLEAYLDDTTSLTTRVRPPAGSRLRVTVPAGAGEWSVRAWRLGSADVTPPPELLD